MSTHTPRIVFDASDAHIDLATAHVDARGGTSPDGRSLGQNNYHLTLDGAPFPVVSGEFIPQRYPVAEWEDALRTMRDAGCSMVSSYVFWSLLEPRAGEFDFSGANDIRRVAEICADLGLLFAPRIGPFNNSEYLVGGLPPWLYGMPLVERSNDPRYLDRVRLYFEKVAEQYRGLFWADGGPIVLIQLENELAHAPNDWRTLFGYSATDHRGPEDGYEFSRHMALLRETAVTAGITPAYFAMTAWGLPDGVTVDGFIPTYGAYMDLHPQSGDNHLLTTFHGGEYPYRGVHPTAFCELGTGSPTRADYRSMTPAGSMMTTAMTRFAAVESLVLGYYLYHGGTNPVRGDGFGWTAKGEGFPLRSYDFWAPVSEFGERRDSFYRAMTLNRFVLEFGDRLATTQVVEPDHPVTDPADDRLRTILRADGDSGFLFFANYGNTVPLPDRVGVSFSVRLSESYTVFPRHSSLAIASGEIGVFPVGLPITADISVISATVQPFARLGSQEHPVVVFHAPRDGVAELTLAGVTADAIHGDAEMFEDEDGITAVLHVTDAVVLDVHGDDRRATIVVIPTDEAEHSALVPAPEGRMLVTSADDLSRSREDLLIRRFLPLTDGEVGDAELRLPTRGTRVRVGMPQPTTQQTDIVVERLSDTRLLLRVPDPSADIDDLWVDIGYTGDLARLFDAGTGILIADDFNKGIPWRIRLDRFAAALRSEGIQMRVEPLSAFVEVPNEEGILLDHAEEVLGDARIDTLTFTQRRTARVPLRSLSR